MQAQLRRLAKHKQCKENNHLASQVNHFGGVWGLLSGVRGCPGGGLEVSEGY